jgi:uncharacterized protein (TIGR00255 family)
MATRGSQRVTVDVRAVNHRFLDLKVRGAQIAPMIEEAVAVRVRSAIERGAVAVSIHVSSEAGAAGTRIDLEAAERAHRSLSQLAARLGTAAPELALVLAQPGVVVTDAAGEEELPVVPALDDALAQLDQMRVAEGAALAQELRARLEELVAVRAQLAALAATVPQHVAKRLGERIKRLLESQELAVLDPTRLAQEVAVVADRSDITEELVRLASHLDQARALIIAPDGAAVGRRLDFLVQEIGRELNTIGSKSAVTEISTAVVDAKAVLEKVREQVQNVE